MKIIKCLNFKPTVELFDTRRNTKLPYFISFRSDPESKGVNAFALSWENLSFYSFPPLICIPRVLQKIWRDKAENIVVVSYWLNQLWYTVYRNDH